MSANKNVSNRIKRENGLWERVKPRFRGSRLTKRLLGRVAEACVESSLLYDRQLHVWCK